MSTINRITASLTHHAAAPGRVAVDPLLIAALVQAIVQVVIACMPEPEDAEAWLAGEWRPRLGWLLPGLRRGRLRRLVAENWKGPHERLTLLTEDVLYEIDLLDGDDLRDIWHEGRRVRAESGKPQ